MDGVAPGMERRAAGAFRACGCVQSTQWFTGRNDANALDQAVNVRPGPRLTEEQLAKMAVAGVNLTPSMGSGTQNVRLQLSAEQPWC